MFGYRLATRRLAFLLLVISALTLPAAAQSVLKFPATTPIAAEGGAEPASPPAEPIAKKRAENAELLRVAQRKADAASPTDPTPAQDVALFKSAESVLAQQEAVQSQIADLKARQEKLKADLQALRADGEELSQPYSFPQFDQFKDELAAEQARMAVTADKVKAATADLERARRSLDELQRKQRLAEASLNAAKEGTDTTELTAVVDQATQAAKLAEETANLRKLELERSELSRDVQKLAVEYLTAKVAHIKPHVNFSEADLNQQLAKLDQREAELKQALARAEQNRTKAQNEWVAVKRQIEQQQGDPAVLTEKLEAWRRAMERYQTEIELLNSQTEQLGNIRLAWTRRYRIANTHLPDGAPRPEEWETWVEETQKTLQNLGTESRTQIQKLDLVRKDVAAVGKKLEAAKEGPAEAVRWIERQRAYLDDLLRLYESALVADEGSRRVHEKLLSEASGPAPTISPTRWLQSAWGRVLDVWNYELYSKKTPADEPDILITVGTVVRGLLLIIAGVIAARMLASLIAHRLLRRFRLSKDAQVAIQTLVFYILLVIIVVWVLNYLSVPLTMFTILGGALAIGVGFGSQAIINNFLSGLIMLAERPVRLGERIVFGNYDGMVEEVGFRSTKLRTLTDHLVTIPNSSLINESIENIGRRRTIRRLINVTITYDTPREKIDAAVQAIRDILNERGIREPIHPIVGFDEMAPRVYFNDFNSESLNILVVYWYAPPDWWPYMEHTERVNMRIMEEFERLGVEFAFPTKTLFLAGDPNRELSVRLRQDQPQLPDAGPYDR